MQKYRIRWRILENKRNAEAFQNAGQIASSKVSFPLEERYQAKIR